MADQQFPTTYGSAVTRITRTPISFGPIADNQSGQFSNDSFLNKLQMLLTLPKMLDSLKPKGQIQVDPNSPDTADLHKTINHEEIHALLQHIDPLNQIQVNPDDVKNLSPYLKGRGGDPNLEIPSYLGAFEPSVTPVPQDVRDKFINDFALQIGRSSKQGAEIYKKLSK